MKALIKASIVVGLSLACSEPRRLWRTDSRTAPSSPRRRGSRRATPKPPPRPRATRCAARKVEGSCYEVYGVKDGKLFELFYSPEDLSLKHTKAK